MAYAVSLDGERCADGVEVVEGATATLAKFIRQFEQTAAELAAMAPPNQEETEPQRLGILGGSVDARLFDPRLLEHYSRGFADYDGPLPSLPPWPMFGGHEALPPPPTPEATDRVIETWSECVRYKSGRMQTFRRTLGEASTALAIKFVMAKGDDALLAFMDEWGIPGWPIGPGSGPGGQPATVEIPMSAIRTQQASLRRIIDLYREGDTRADGVLGPSAGWSDLRPILKRPRGAKKPILTLETKSLIGFMDLEVGAIIAGGSKVLRCEHCSKIYATGDYEGKHRRIGRFCSNRCRVADQRARAKAKAALK
jgi:hypothetical protein